MSPIIQCFASQKIEGKTLVLGSPILHCDFFVAGNFWMFTAGRSRADPRNRFLCTIVILDLCFYISQCSISTSSIIQICPIQIGWGQSTIDTCRNPLLICEMAGFVCFFFHFGRCKSRVNSHGEHLMANPARCSQPQSRTGDRET